MHTQTRTSRTDTTVPLAPRRHAITYGLLLLPVSILIAISALLASKPLLPPALLAMMVILTFCQIALICLALQHLLPAKLAMSGDGLTIHRFMNTETHAWRDVANIDVTPATGTLLDNPFCALEQRVGVGLTLRGSVKSSKELLLPDVIIAASDATHTIRMMQLAERIQQFRIGLASSSPQRQPLKARQANQKAQFTSRQPTTAAL